jgi:hypothetical protein
VSDSRCIVQAKLAEVATTTQYTAPRRDATTGAGVQSYRVKIEKFSVAPPAAGSETISVYVVAYGGTAGASNKIFSHAIASTDRTYTCPELIGHVLEPGDFIATSATAATMVIRADGDFEKAP